MRSPFTEYNNHKDKDKRRESGYEYFNEKYFKKPFQPQGFLESEERLLAQKLKFFIPGRIYTWQYDPLYADFLDFYDERPMVLVHSQFVAKNTGNMIVQGLNLNFLPEFQRVQTMEIFSKVFKADLQEANRAIGKGEIGILKEAWKFLTDWLSTLKIFNTAGKIGYQWAYRNYIIERITEPVLIELEDWPMIPYFVPKEFKGKMPAEVWAEYAKVKDELSAKQPDADKSKLNQGKYTKP